MYKDSLHDRQPAHIYYDQVEEEKTVSGIVKQLKLTEVKGTAVIMLEHQMDKCAKD